MSIRNWLEKNKIFFETITAVLLAVMAIVVSLKANQIASYQTSLMKLEHLPILRFDIDLIFDPAKSAYVHDQLIISNEGSPLSEFSYERAVFFKIEYYGTEGEKRRSDMIPVLGYYDTTFVTNNVQGELATFSNVEVNEGNNLKATQVAWGFDRLIREKDSAFAFADIVRYIQVYYKDIWGETHEEIYFVDTYGTRKLPEIEGAKILSEYKNKSTQPLFVELSKVSPESLYTRWLMIVQESKERTK